MLLQGQITGPLIKKAAGINAKRKLPVFPPESFAAWARRRKLHQKPRANPKRKVAYFAGCTAQYLFPAVPKAAVEVLERNQVAVFFPEQHCCGMPSMLEGDRKLTLRFAERTVSRLAGLVDDGYDVVCSCPTCGYMLKNALPEFAYYSQAYQDFIGGDERNMIIPNKRPTQTANTGQCGMPAPYKAPFGGHHMASKTVEMAEAAGRSTRKVELRVLDKSIYGKILKDDGYFSGIDPLKRIKVAENTHDLGEYLLECHRRGELDTRLAPHPGRKAYYPPCHLREQEIGQPYLALMALIPDMAMEAIQSTVYCCGIAGIMGFKRDFHKASIQMGSRLMAKIKRIDPDQVVTDCLSCRLQFNQMSAYPVQHPIETLNEAYQKVEGPPSFPAC